jgi:aubergine-like protein
VIADYGNFRIYKITDIDFTKSPQNHVQINNQPVSLMDYYKKGYNLTIQNARQPLLVYQRKMGKKEDQQIQSLYLIPELCKFAGLLDE